MAKWTETPEWWPISSIAAMAADMAYFIFRLHLAVPSLPSFHSRYTVSSAWRNAWNSCDTHTMVVTRMTVTHDVLQLHSQPEHASYNLQFIFSKLTYQRHRLGKNVLPVLENGRKPLEQRAVHFPGHSRQVCHTCDCR